MSNVKQPTNGLNGHTNGHTARVSRFDPHFTDNVVRATGPKANPRLRKVFGSLVRHLHDFCRENEITVDEYMQAIDMINWAGQMSTDQRNEGQLLTDILGLESLVDEITYKLADEAQDAPTATAILGPFWRKDAPIRKNGDSIILNDIPDGDHTLMHGKVLDFNTGKPIQGAEIDVWHTAPNGLYEQQDPNQPDFNLRGRFYTEADGSYNFYCLRPTSYPIPMDGPAGKLLQLLDRHPMRPAHIHFIISAPGYKPIVTQIFDRRDEHITDDSVFAVKDSLIVDFVPKKGDPKAQFDLLYDFKLASFESTQRQGMKGATEVALL
ncbi:aromatic compound dioxygenase [Teratosphaeria nubilosa]|uniref:Aromatic compound dioxygenase n=1 Tax=Teratosphaeria nubilosa TaxID=161662 RepID=A0A6G1L9Y4_9PEZI|nr:aromatic compound dioxygenase [Teratosphaeria nubilosa]